MDNALPTTTTLTVGTNSTFNLNGFNQTLTGLASSGTGTRVVTNNGASPSTLTIAGGTGSFGGTIQDGTSTLALAVSGSGTAFTLTGANTYTGGTTINNGATVQISSSSNLGATSGTAVINAGTLQVTADVTTTRALALNSASSAIAVDANRTYTLNGSLGGTGTLNKTGAGRLVLNTPASTGYTGGTDVIAGVLELHAAVSGKTVVGTGATLDASFLPAGELNLNATQVIETSGLGTGTVLGSLNSAGIVSPGGDGKLGTLAVTGGTTLSNGASLKIEVAGPGSNDALHTPSLTLGNNVSLNLLVLGNYVATAGTLYVVADPTSVTNGLFANTSSTNYGSLFNAYTATPNETLSTIQTSDGQKFAVSYTGSSTQFEAAGGTDVVLMAVPEPSMTGTLLAGLGVLAGLQRFRSRSRRAAARG